MEIINKCRVCKNPDIKEFLNLGNQPPANSLLKNIEENEKFYPLSLSWCPGCNLVQLNQTLDPKDLFSDYIWVTGTSETAREYAKKFYNEALVRTGDIKDSYILEIASNDGTFLQPFMENGYKVLGIDPAKNIAEMAIKKGVPTLAKFFGEGLAKEIVKTHGKSKFVFARNVIPHVSNLNSVIEGLKIVSDDKGVIAIETHYAKIIFEELHYDSIYHEHLCYFTLKSMEHLLNQHGLYIFDIEKSPICGGSLVYYIKKYRDEEEKSVRLIKDEEEKIKLNEFYSWQEFAKKTHTHKEKLLEILEKGTGKVIGYGASARSSTLLNFCGIDKDKITIIADQNPLKHKKYTAGTHIPIDSPNNVMKQNPNTVFILAWNFANEISETLKNKYGFRGKLIVPLPNEPRVIGVD